MSETITKTTRTLTLRDTGEGWEILVDGVLVLRWTGNGISTDTVFHEKPRRVFPKTTTPHWRCLRMLFEGWAHVLVSALTDRPSGEGWASAREHGDVEPSAPIPQRLVALVDQMDSVAEAMLDAAREIEAGAEQ